MYATEQGILNGQYNAVELACRAAEQQARPSAIYRPKLQRDGNEWVALYGDNLQIGVVGLGNTPDEAMIDFDKKWHKEI